MTTIERTLVKDYSEIMCGNYIGYQKVSYQTEDPSL